MLLLTGKLLVVRCLLCPKAQLGTKSSRDVIKLREVVLEKVLRVIEKIIEILERKKKKVEMKKYVNNWKTSDEKE